MKNLSAIYNILVELEEQEDNKFVLKFYRCEAPRPKGRGFWLTAVFRGGEQTGKTPTAK